MAELPPGQLVCPVGDDLVGVHVGLGAGAGLPHHQREVLVEGAAHDLVAGLGDGGKLLVGHLLGLEGVVGDGGGLFQHAEGMGDLPGHGLDAHADQEILVGTLGLRAPVLVGGHFDLAHGIVFDAVVHICFPPVSHRFSGGRFYF